MASGATGNQLNVTDSVQALLAKINSISGATTPSTISGGAITLHGADGANLSITQFEHGGVRRAWLQRPGIAQLRRRCASTVRRLLRQAI